jgi:pyruvate,water dikinase
LLDCELSDSASQNTNAPVPLTPALSLGERGKVTPPLEKSNRSGHPERHELANERRAIPPLPEGVGGGEGGRRLHTLDAATIAQIDALTSGYADKPQFFVDKLAQGVAMIAAAFYPKDVILRLSDFKTNEYANLIGGRAYEPAEENPMIGFRGASRYYNPRYQAGFALECRAVKKVREDMGLTNLKVMIPFCRTVEEGRRVEAELEKHGLKRGASGLDLYVMCEIPSNVILAEEFADIFDGFSIGSNDLTQLILGVDRDSEIVAPIFDERNAAVKKMIAQIIAVCRAKKRKIGICGQAPSDYPDFAQFLVEQGIDSISLNPDTVLKTTVAIVEKEKALQHSKPPPK